MMKIQLFLSSQDPYKSKNFILLTLKDRLKTIQGYERVLCEIMNLLVENFEDCLFMTPDEKFGFIRLIPHLMVLLDGDVTDPKSFNIFNTKKIAISTLQKLMKRYTVVPLHADMSITLLYILERCPHFNFFTVGDTWGSYSNTGVKGKIEKGIESEYDIRFDWLTIKSDYSHFLVQFTAYMNQLSKTSYCSIIDNESLNAMSSDEFSLLEAAKIAMELSLKGFTLLSQWKAQLQLTLAWKYTHPNCSKITDTNSAPNYEVTVPKEEESNEQQGLEYEQVIQRNFRKEELTIVVGIISRIKSLSSILSNAEVNLSPLLRIYAHHRIQHIARGDLLPLLHRVDKRKKTSHLAPLLKIRDLVADYGQDKNKDDEDFKSYSRKQGNVHVKHQLRAVSVSNSQLYMFRSQIHAICDETSVYRQKKGLLGKADMEKEDIQSFEIFYKESFFYPYLLNFQDTLMRVSDMGDLWYREFYLELTKCVQLPIEMSLPWILIELVICNQNSSESDIPMIQDVFHILDIYNDAAHQALHAYHQQHLYDEIEAEANLVLEQLIVSLSEDSYEYYKNVTASNMLEKSYKRRLEEIRGETFLTIGIQKFDSLITQRNIIILGRSLNLSVPIIQHVVRRVYNDIDIAIRIFESDDICCVIELKGLLDIIKETHRVISDQLEIVDYDLIFNEVNESISSPEGKSRGRGRIMNHCINSINNDIIPNFSYNSYTKRFVRSPMPLDGNEDQSLEIKSRNYGATVKLAEINRFA
jgi:cytoplasmic FMR1 interacting protein